MQDDEEEKDEPVRRTRNVRADTPVSLEISSRSIEVGLWRSSTDARNCTRIYVRCLLQFVESSQSSLINYQ